MREKARFQIEDVIVAVTCPHCEARQPSPNYPTSHGWDKADVKKFGARGAVTCGNCRERFLLPVKLLELFAGL
jgi:transcription elongation factor Elf1